jgi:hypothetical protein
MVREKTDFRLFDKCSSSWRISEDSVATMPEQQQKALKEINFIFTNIKNIEE